MTARDERKTMTISDIAAQAGVSRSTVSRVLLDSPLVSQESRSAVEAVVRAHRYQPNINARRLRSSRLDIVSVVIPLAHDQHQTVHDPFFMRMVAGLCDELSALGFDMMLSKSGAADIGAVERIVRQRRADGVILLGQSAFHEQIDSLAREDFPLVIWGAEIPGQRYACVSSDNTAAGLMVGRHLLRAGRRRIAVFGNVDVPETRQRLEGLRTALRDTASGLVPELMLPVSFRFENALSSISEFLREKPRFDAVFAMSDTIAHAAIVALERAGSIVPDDVAVVGFDDIEIGGASGRALTTVRQDMDAACETLARLLIEQIGGMPRRSVVIPTSFIERSSA